MKKKKKKSKKVDFSAFEDGQDQEGDDAARDPDDIFAADDEEGAARSSSKAGTDAEEGWIGSNRDYTYTEVIKPLCSFCCPLHIQADVFTYCWTH